jgi:hypothetical protein
MRIEQFTKFENRKLTNFIKNCSVFFIYRMINLIYQAWDTTIYYFKEENEALHKPNPGHWLPGARSRQLATEAMGSQARDAPLPAEKKINASFNTNVLSVEKNSVPFNTNDPSQGSQTNVSLPPPSRQVKRNSQTKY